MLSSLVATIVAIFMAVSGFVTHALITEEPSVVTETSIHTEELVSTSTVIAADESKLVVNETKTELPSIKSIQPTKTPYYRNTRTGEILTQEQFNALIKQKSQAGNIPKVNQVQQPSQPSGTLCKGKYWTDCPAGQKFVCPDTGNAYCASPTQQKISTNVDISVPNTTTGQLIESEIDGVFTGWNGDTLYKLSNGQFWQQSEYSYSYSYAYRPEVLIYSVSNGYKMRVVGEEKDIPVQQIFNVIESRIRGDFNGWEGETIYELTNGQIWQQSNYHYHYHYAYSPEVWIYPSRSGGYKMHVDGDSDQDINVKRLK